MQGHVIVCGAGSTGHYIIDELVIARTPVVAIDRDAEELERIAERHPPELFHTIVGDATDEEVLARASLAQARGVVAVLPNDKDNIYIVVESRQVNPKARIIARAAEMSHVDKIRRVGADGIVTPAQIGGLRIVSEMLRPLVVRFLDEMLRDPRAFRIEEITIKAGAPLVGKTLRDAALRQRHNMTVLAISRDSAWIYNPDPEEKLGAGTTIVVLAAAPDVAALRTTME